MSLWHGMDQLIRMIEYFEEENAELALLYVAELLEIKQAMRGLQEKLGGRSGATMGPPTDSELRCRAERDAERQAMVRKRERAIVIARNKTHRLRAMQHGRFFPKAEEEIARERVMAREIERAADRERWRVMKHGPRKARGS